MIAPPGGTPPPGNDHPSTRKRALNENTPENTFEFKLRGRSAPRSSLRRALLFRFNFTLCSLGCGPGRLNRGLNGPDQSERVKGAPDAGRLFERT